MTQSGVVVFHDRNLGFSKGFEGFFGIDRVFVSETFTEKLYSLNRGTWSHVAALERSRTDVLERIWGMNPKVLLTAPFCAPFSNLNRTHSPLDDDPLKHPKLQDALQAIQAATHAPNKPKIFIMESVARATDFMWKVLAPRLNEAGYYVTVWAHDAGLFGVPQSRQRTFILASQYANFDTTIIDRWAQFYQNDPRLVKYVLETVPQPQEPPQELPARVADVLAITPQGQKLRRVFKKTVGDPEVAAPGLGYYRLHANSLAPVISQSTVLFHPTFNRYLSVPEILRFLTFPTNIEIPGKWINVYRLGNGVMPMISGLLSVLVKGQLIDLESGYQFPERQEERVLLDYTTTRGSLLENDPIPEWVEGLHPEWRGRFKIRGWKNDRSQR